MTATVITETITNQHQVAAMALIFDRSFRAAFAEVAEWQTAHPRQSAYNDYFMSGLARIAGMVTSHRDMMPDAAYLDDAKVIKHSKAQAEILTASYAFKVEAKAAGMTDVTVSAMKANGSFTVTGTKAGHSVEIRQSVVTKTSPKGTWFHQFPALVYIDGKKSTEKALKAL